MSMCRTLSVVARVSTAAILTVVMTAGCVSEVHIWANSDAGSPDEYSRVSPQRVYIGETMQFRVTVQPDVASYVLLDFEGQQHILSRIREGEYSYSHYFGEDWRRRVAKLDVRAYRQRGRRDYVREGERIVHRLRQGDDPDELVGSASMTLRCYQATVSMRVHLPNGVKPDWEKAWLELTGRDGHVKRVTLGQPGQHGFIVLGPSAFGEDYTVFYEPRHDEVQTTGKTKVVFKMPLSNGTQYKQEQQITVR